jgi:hypothetical protein
VFNRLAIVFLLSVLPAQVSQGSTKPVKVLLIRRYHDMFKGGCHRRVFKRLHPIKAGTTSDGFELDCE